MTPAVFKAPRGRNALKPPAEFDDAAKAVWARVVSSRPVEFYDQADADMLRRYCLLEVRLRDLERRMDEDPDAVKDFIQLTRLHIALARALRVSKLSVVSGESAVNKRRSPHREWLQEG